MSHDLIPFEVHVPEADLTDLRDRLARTRWIEKETVGDWSQGIPLDYVQEICAYWQTKYDWRATEAKLNQWPQFKTELDGLGIHYIHVRSNEQGALPLILTHGWPGSVVEFLNVIGPLTDPSAYGGDPADAFDVICPSLPGYGFSDKPREPGWTTERIARAWTTLVHRLGYDRHVAQGGDWGAAVTTYMGLQADPDLAMIHVNRPLIDADPTTTDLTEKERATLERQAFHQMWGTGYSRQQSTRPQTLGYGLVDSPVAQAAWVLEKFWAWTDCDGHPENAISRDELLDNVMLYWLTATGGSSARLYWESFRDANQEPVLVPTGISIFPMENLAPSRRWVERRYQNIQYWNELDKGGHFPSLEQPEAFVEELRNCFRPARR